MRNSQDSLHDVRSYEAFCDAFSLDGYERAAIDTYDRHLLEWSSHTNLIARASIEDRWHRHYVDSAQLWPLLSDQASSVLDMGSGAGFPGLVLAILSAKRAPNRAFTLVDSVGKKARFLEEVAEAIGLRNITISARRVEVFHVEQNRFDLIMARAMTALPRLLDIAAPLLAPDGMLIFPKGEKAEEELTAASTRWRFNLERRQSTTHPKASILVITQPKAIL